MADIFNEIEEEIRHDRSKVVWKKYGKYVIGLAVAIVLATAGHTGWREYEKSVRVDRSDRFVAAVAKVGENDVESAAGLFSALGEDGGAGYGTLARFQAAALKAESGDKEGAVVVGKEQRARLKINFDCPIILFNAEFVSYLGFSPSRRDNVHGGFLTGGEEHLFLASGVHLVRVTGAGRIGVAT